MKIDEFFRLYANTPFKERAKPIAAIGGKHYFTLSDLFVMIRDLEDQMRPYRIREEELLRTAEKVLKPGLYE